MNQARVNAKGGDAERLVQIGAAGEQEAQLEGHGRWPLRWAIKFPLVMAVTLVVPLATYHLLVSNTFIGLMVNDKRSGKQPGSKQS